MSADIILVAAARYKPSMLLGRLTDGAQSDHGTRVHLFDADKNAAVCGAKPGRRSVGWSHTHGTDRGPMTVTCPRCQHWLVKKAAK